MTLRISRQSLLAYKTKLFFFFEKSVESLIGAPLWVTNAFFFFPAFQILSLSLTFDILIMMCLGVGLFGFILVGILCASWTCVSISFTKLGKFSVIIFSNRFPISCSFSYPSGSPMMQMLVYLRLSQRLLTSHFFFYSFFLLTVLIGWFLLPYTPTRWFDSRYHPLYCWFPVNFSLFHLV